MILQQSAVHYRVRSPVPVCVEKIAEWLGTAVAIDDELRPFDAGRAWALEQGGVSGGRVGGGLPASPLDGWQEPVKACLAARTVVCGDLHGGHDKGSGGVDGLSVPGGCTMEQLPVLLAVAMDEGLEYTHVF